MTNDLIKRLESLINHALSLDAESMQAFGDLSGKVISLEFINTGLSLYLFPGVDGLHISCSYEGDVSVRIRGTPSDMFSYLMSARQGSNNFAGALEIIGDVGLAQRFQSIVKGIDMDWEEHLSRIVGDTAAHKIGNLFRNSMRLAADTKRTLELDISEYLLYEKEVLPERSEIENFSSMVDELRNDIERLKVRIDKLSRTLVKET